MKAGVLFCRVVVLGVFHKFRPQDLKALGRLNLGGLPEWADMRKAGWCHSGWWILASRPGNIANFTRRKEGIKLVSLCMLEVQ